MYLVDTDVIAEARKHPHAHPGVAAFLEDALRKRTSLFASVITIGEIRQAVCALRRRGSRTAPDSLQDWLERLLRDHRARIIPFDAETAVVWGSLRLQKAGHPVDTLIAATALLHDLAVVTGKTDGYRELGVRVFDPYEQSSIFSALLSPSRRYTSSVRPDPCR